MEKDLWGSTMGIYTNDLKSKYILNELPSTLLVILKSYKRKRTISSQTPQNRNLNLNRNRK